MQATPFLIPTTREGVYELHVDNSSKELFETCARAAEYYTVQRRELAGERATLFRGDVVHGALAIRKHAQVQGCKDTKDFEPQQLEYILKAYEGKDFGPDEWRIAEHCINTIRLYNEQWPIASEPFTIASVDGKPLIEWPFKLALGHADLSSEITINGVKTWLQLVEIFWTGRMDTGIVYGQELVEEHKTTSILGQTYFDDFQLSSQGLSYVWAANKLGFPAKGLLLDALAGRKPSKSGKAHEYMRQRLFYEQDHLDEWERDTFTLITDFLEHLCRGYFPKSTKWCHGKYGECQYWQVCTQTPTNRDSILQSELYKNVTWSPLNGKK